VSHALRIAVAAVFAAAVAALGAGSAGAAEESRSVEVVEAGTALFPDRAYVLTLDQVGESVLSTDDVSVTENGAPVQNLAVQTGASAQGIGTVLLIDASNSMRDSIDEAMSAARAFVARNPGQPLSVVFFNKLPRVALPLTTDRKRVTAVLSKSPKLAEGTRIYDALAAAVAQVRGSALGAARVVLLSDGDDVGSLTTLDSALKQLDDEKIRVFTVGIESSDFSSADLERIASETDATYVAASSADGLTKVYNELGFQLGNEYLLRYRSGAAPDQKVDVQVSVAGAQPVSFSYDSPEVGAGGPYAPNSIDKVYQSWLLIPLLILLMLALGYFAARSLWSLRSNKALVARLGDFVTLPEEERAAARRREVDLLLSVAGEKKKRKRNWRWLEGFSEDVDIAQIERDPRQLVWTSVIAGLVLGVVAAALLGPFWIWLVVVPTLTLNLVVRGKARHTRNEFSEQLPENLDVLASALRAGHSLAGAMGVVADEAPQPSKREFSRVVTDESLGIPLDEALEVTAKRMQSSDMDQVAVLALVQREAGGNTAEVLDQVTANIRARMDIRRLVKVLTSQGKFSSWVIAAVPVGVFLFLVVINPTHLDPLFHQTVGQIASVAAIIMMILGFYIIRRIISIEL